ncbi:MAG: hypothetical protein A2W74_01070 [Planctomycetes bacterium RIFCSPLOWO2_12_38_17]|nr:MAG: hypothetical protein A2W74_01070 [Planctomycetes bacterium RIFCSPLOWO2_12_38_17]
MYNALLPVQCVIYEIELMVYGSKSLGEQMTKWQCQVCEYIYDPEDGDLDHGVNPRTPFEN